MDWNPKNAWDKLAAFLKSTLSRLPSKPKGVIVISAHWLENAFTVTAGSKHSLYYDYYGFPKHTYDLKYNVPGSPELADKVVSLLTASNLPTAKDTKRGLDHGVFIPMILAVPDSEQIPTIQLSLHKNMDADLHLKLGKALESLRDEGILIIGSGMSFHNMAAFNNPAYLPKSEKFDCWLAESMVKSQEERTKAILNWESAPNARDCHPPRAEEHLVPLFVNVGAAGENSVGKRVFHDVVMGSHLSAFEFN